MGTRRLFSLALAAALPLIFGLFALAPAGAHAQVYGGGTSATLGTTLTYGQSEIVTLPDGTQETIICEAAVCPAGEVFTVAEGTSAYSYGATYSEAAYLEPYAYGGYSVACVYCGQAYPYAYPFATGGFPFHPFFPGHHHHP